MRMWNIPNQLTLSRIILVPVVLVLLELGTKWTCLFAFAFFVVASLTDFIDGYLARRVGQVTNLGKLLDPLADKVLVASVLLMLASMGWVNVWVAIVIVCRDIMVTGLRAMAAETGVVIAADKFGKLKTISQLLALGPLILHYPWLGIPFESIGQFLLYIALVLTVFSGVNYFVVYFREQKTIETEDKDG